MNLLPRSASRPTQANRKESSGMSFPMNELVGGALIGLSATVLLMLSGRIAGISSIIGGLVGATRDERTWRGAFLAGLLVGGVVLGLWLPGALTDIPVGSASLMILAGLLVGAGTQIGGGCTSGHGVCGISRFSARSIVATMTFMFTGVIATFVVRHLLVSS
jgi:uncharacterized protein